MSKLLNNVDADGLRDIDIEIIIDAGIYRRRSEKFQRVTLGDSYDCFPFENMSIPVL